LANLLFCLWLIVFIFFTIYSFTSQFWPGLEFVSFVGRALGWRLSPAKLPPRLILLFDLAILAELFFFRWLIFFSQVSPHLTSFVGRALGWRFSSAPPPAQFFLFLALGI
jgi:hypothetical protein